MCKAIEDLAKEFEARGEARGLERGRFNTLFEMVYDGLISMAQAAGRVNMTEEQFRSKMAEAGYSLKQ